VALKAVRGDKARADHPVIYSERLRGMRRHHLPIRFYRTTSASKVIRKLRHGDMMNSTWCTTPLDLIRIK
jgi:hypothetical protein